MTSDKETIFASIRKALEGVEKSPRPPIDFSRIVAERRLEHGSPWDCFRKNFESVRGFYADSIPALQTFILQHGLKKGYCDPALKEILGEPLSESLEIEYSYPRDQVDELPSAGAAGAAPSTAAEPTADAFSASIEDQP